MAGFTILKLFIKVNVAFIVASHINGGSSHKGKNLLPSEPILSLKSRTLFCEDFLPQVSKQKDVKIVSL